VNLITGINFDKSSGNNESLFREFFQNEINNSFCIFTDGSKTPNLDFTGFSITSLDHSFKFKFRTTSHASIFSLEAMAILESIIQATNLHLTNITIFSDSKSVLSALQNISFSNNTSYLIYEIRHRIKLFSDNDGSANLI